MMGLPLGLGPAAVLWRAAARASVVRLPLRLFRLAVPVASACQSRLRLCRVARCPSVRTLRRRRHSAGAAPLSTVMGLWLEPSLGRPERSMEICPRRFDGDRDACGFVPGFFLNAVALNSWPTQVTGTRIVVSIAADVFSSKPREEPVI